MNPAQALTPEYIESTNSRIAAILKAKEEGKTLITDIFSTLKDCERILKGITYSFEEVKHEVIQNSPVKVTMQTVLREVAERYGVDVEDVTGKSRRRIHLVPRRAFILISHRNMKKTLGEIGRWLDNRDHTSIIHHVNGNDNSESVYQQYANDLDFRANVDAIQSALVKNSVIDNEESNLKTEK